MDTAIVQKCYCCSIDKPIEQFVKDKYTHSGYKRLCKQCNVARTRAYQKANPAKTRQTLLAWREVNRQYWLDYCRFKNGRNSTFIPKERQIGKSREEAREAAKQRKRDYDRTHQSEIHQYRQRTQERRRINKRFYRQNREARDPNYKMTNVLRSRFGALIKNQSSERALELLGCDMPFFIHWIQRNFEHGMTWTNHGKGQGKWNIDHNIPCASFDLTDPEQQKRCFHWTNLFPMWDKHNNAKRSTLWVLDYEI